MLRAADELSRADQRTDQTHPSPRQPLGPSPEFVAARETRAAGLVGGLSTAQIAAEIHDRCAQLAGTSRIRAYRLALGVSLADVVAQIRAWYVSEGRPAPRFSETLLSAYESGQKRPGPVLCARPQKHWPANPRSGGSARYTAHR